MERSSIMTKKRCTVVLLLMLLLVIPLTGSAQERLKLSTTTSTENSGLLAVLLPPFEKLFNVKVDVIAVGSGKAIVLGKNGDVDVVLVHERAAEDKFVAEGDGVNRRDVMYNDFIIAGPQDDPANIRGLKNAADAFAGIAKAGARFISRGDQSGTHIKEKDLWAKAGIVPQGKWYHEVGQGMGAVLKMADETKAYTLTDRGTYLAMTGKLKLETLCEGDAVLLNPYGIIAVNPAKFPHVNYLKAMALIGWITSQEGQKIIREFGKEKFGQPLFYPTAIK